MRIFPKVFIFLIAVLNFCSCKTSFPVSEYAKYNEVKDSYFRYYSNDSLGLSLDFLGRQRIQPGFVQPKLTRGVRRILKKRIKGLDAKMFYASRPTGRYFGYKLYGFIFDERSNKYTDQLKTKNYSFYNAPYYSDMNNLTAKGQWRSRDILLPLKNNKNIFFIWVKEMDPAFDSDWSESEEKLFVQHITADLSTLSTGDGYKTRQERRDSLLKETDRLVQNPEYIGPLSAFNRVNEDSIDSYGLTSFFYQMKANAYSFIDNLDSVKESNIKSFSGATRETNNNDEIDSLVFYPDYEDSIKDLAKKAQVLMFNESHYDWRNRWLVTGMLPELKKMGYKYLSMEALWSKDSVNARGIPSLRDGFYYKEPFMGNLLRTALDLGFKIVGYEDTIADHTTIDERERTLASNLYYQFNKDPGAKWLVYAGYAHINKNGYSKGQPSMLQYFKKLCKADVKCINQTKYSPFFYGTVNTGYPDKGNFAVADLKKKDPDADLFVVSDLDKLPYEDSAVSKKMGFRKYNLKKDIVLSEHSSDYLFVYRESEYLSEKQNAIPVVIKKVSELKRTSLYLPENKYLFFAVDANDKLDKLQ